MASSVFYRFKSSREPSRVTFDGTSISVFELKKEIISLSGLGNGLDFELVLSSNDGDREYEDDTEIVPRSTTVIAKRLPAARPGRGGAARYVSGKPPLNAKTSNRTETGGGRPVPAQDIRTGLSTNTGVADAQSESERMEAVLKMGAEQWKRKQMDMANATPVHRAGVRTRQGNVPNHSPPPYYTCHRCEKKGHWLQECPENGNPAFDDKRRVKKTMGIPRSQLKVIEKKPVVSDDGKVEDARPPPGVMVDADGNWVIAKPDQVAWERYQEKATKSAAAKEEANRGSEELQQKGLECPLDKRLFLEPTKTPCCEKTYCKQCITNALLDDGLECPGCGKEGVPIDDLNPDTVTAAKVEEYKRTKEAAVAAPEGDARSAGTAAGRSPQTGRHGESATKPIDSNPERTGSLPGEIVANSRKRRAGSDADERGAKSPKPGSGGVRANGIDASQITAAPRDQRFPAELAFLNQPPFANPGGMAPVNGFLGAPAGVGPMGMGMWNPMMMPYGPAGNQWGATGGYGESGSSMPNMRYGPPAFTAGAPNVPTGPAAERRFMPGQQSKMVGPRAARGDDSAYTGQPVNSHRQGRRNPTGPANF